MKNEMKSTYKRLAQLIESTETYKEAAKRMNAKGYKTAKGKKWSANNIASWVFNNWGKDGYKINNPEPKTLPKTLSKVKAVLSKAESKATKKLAMIKRIVNEARV